MGALAIAQEFMEHASRLDVIENITCWGPRYGDKKIEFLRQADVLVLPSFDEAFPLVILEGMAAGLPIIATIMGGTPDMVMNEVNGLLSQPQDEKSLASVLKKLATDKSSRQKMGIESRWLFEEKYTLSIFKKNMLTMLFFELESKM